MSPPCCRIEQEAREAREAMEVEEGGDGAITAPDGTKYEAADNKDEAQLKVEKEATGLSAAPVEGDAEKGVL